MRRRAMSGSRPWRSPMMRTRTLLRCSSARSLRMKRRNRPINSPISLAGRDQFSALNENIVRYLMPRSPAARTVRRKASTPRRCPSPRGNPRAAAQRPLPSMMMATWRGGAHAATRESSASGMGLTSDREDLLFLRPEHLVDLRDHSVRHFLDLGGKTVVIVLADLVFLFEPFDDIEAVAAHMTHGHPCVFRIFVRDLDEFAATLLVELGNPQPDHLSLGRRRETEIRVDDGLLDRVHQRAVPDIDADKARLGHAHRRDLVERHLRAIGVDVDRVEQMRRGASGTQAGEFRPEHRGRPLHASFELVDVMGFMGHGDPPGHGDVAGARAPQPTTVARPFPRSTVAIAPFSAIENTMIGIRFSRASAKAVPSMTRRSFSSASWCVSLSYRRARGSFFGSAV